MRQAPQMRAELDGVTVLRPGVPDVRRSVAGTTVRMRPQLEPGEILLERLGMIPEIIKESDVPKPINVPNDRERRDMYRDEMVRATVGMCPAILAKEANPIALDNLARQLVDAEGAKAILRANGYGRHTDSIADMVKALVTGERKKP